MGVRPPRSNNGDDGPGVVTFGIAALDAHLQEEEVSYPLDSETLVRELGDPEVPYDVSGRTVSLSAALADTHLSRYENEQELLNALHPVFEARREQAGSGLIAQLRSMLPF
jgi:hypothetical protein